MNSIQNFNIPVVDFNRAVQFYSELLGYELQTMDFHGVLLGLFKFDKEKGGVGGALIKSKDAKPSKEGTIVFLQCGDDLQKCLNRIAYRKLPEVSPKTSIGENMGYFCIIEDTEGNRIGLYSQN